MAGLAAFRGPGPFCATMVPFRPNHHFTYAIVGLPVVQRYQECSSARKAELSGSVQIGSPSALGRGYHQSVRADKPLFGASGFWDFLQKSQNGAVLSVYGGGACSVYGVGSTVGPPTHLTAIVARMPSRVQSCARTVLFVGLRLLQFCPFLAEWAERPTGYSLYGVVQRRWSVRQGQARNRAYPAYRSTQP